MRIVCADNIKSAIKRPGVLLPRRVFKPGVEVQSGRSRGERLGEILRVNTAGKQGFSGKLGGDGFPIKAGAATTIAGVKNKLVDAVSYRSGPLLTGLAAFLAALAAIAVPAVPGGPVMETARQISARLPVACRMVSMSACSASVLPW